MSKDKDKWLDDLRHRVNGYEQEPPQGLWDAVQTRLQQEGWTCKPRHHTAPWVLLSRRAGVAACLVGLLALSVTQLPHWQQDTTQAPMTRTTNAALPPRSTTQASAPSIAQASMAGAQTTPVVAQAAPVLAQAASTRPPSSTTSLSTAIPPIDVARTTTAESSTEEPATASVQVANATEKQQMAVAAATPSVMTRAAKHEQHTATSTHSTQAEVRYPGRQRLSLSTYTAGGTGMALNARDLGHSPVTALGPDEASWEDNPSLGMAIYNQGRAIERTLHHRLPVQVGASVSYGLTDRLDLGSGLSYTRLHSDLHEGSGNNYVQGTQNLHYVGLPITLRYTMLRFKGLEVYALGGGKADLRVAGKVRRNYILDGEERGSDTQHIHSHPLQMSARVAAGVQYCFTPALALYAEPGVAHYFHDGSSVPTIYKERPTDFTLSVGLRFCVGK